MTYRRTLRTHQRTAPKVQNVGDALRLLGAEIHGRYPTAHPASRAIVNLHNTLSKLRSALDTDFHSLISDDEARRLGNIYYVGSCPHTTDIEVGSCPFPRLERQQAVGIVDDSDVDLTEADSEEEDEEEEDTERDEVISRLLIRKPDCDA